MNDNRQQFSKSNVKPEERALAVEKLAQQIFVALVSENFNKGKKDALKAVLFELASDLNLTATDEDLIKVSFPLICESLHPMYNDGICQTISTILSDEANSNLEFRNELDSIEAAPGVQPAPELDSAVSNLEEKFVAENELNLTNVLSDLIAGEYGELPKPLYDAIMQGLDKTGENFETYYSGDDIGSGNYIHEYLLSHRDDNEAIEFVKTVYGEKLALVLDALLDNKSLPSELEIAITNALSLMLGDDERSIDKEVIAELLAKKEAAPKPASDCVSVEGGFLNAANQILAVLNNDIVSQKLRRIIEDELNRLAPEDDSDVIKTPENIAFNLKALLNEEFTDDEPPAETIWKNVSKKIAERDTTGRTYSNEGDTIDEFSGSKLAKTISLLLENDNLPNKVHNAICDALTEIAPDEIQDSDYDAETIAEIFKHDSRKKVISESNKDAQLEGIANRLSEVMSNPLLPKQAYDVLDSLFSRIKPHFTDAAENILFNLKEMRGEENSEVSE